MIRWIVKFVSSQNVQQLVVPLVFENAYPHCIASCCELS